MLRRQRGTGTQSEEVHEAGPSIDATSFNCGSAALQSPDIAGVILQELIHIFHAQWIFLGTPEGGVAIRSAIESSVPTLAWVRNGRHAELLRELLVEAMMELIVTPKTALYYKPIADGIPEDSTSSSSEDDNDKKNEKKDKGDKKDKEKVDNDKKGKQASKDKKNEKKDKGDKKDKDKKGYKDKQDKEKAKGKHKIDHKDEHNKDESKSEKKSKTGENKPGLDSKNILSLLANTANAASG